MAQVKLSFNGTSGARMVATRSLSLTVKKTTRQQKTLEGQLLMIKDGERTSISSRVAELDQILPQYLGVSKAVLDNVIFCHQDESLWPMSEPSVLKKKFDEIFEALKYTKAIDNIKDLKKAQMSQLATYKVSEQYAKDDKDKADRAEKKSRELSAEIEKLREETQELHAKAHETGIQAMKAWNQVAAFGLVVGSLEVASQQQGWLEEQLADLGRDLQERTEPDADLQSELDSYEERMKIHKKRQQEQTRRYSEINEEITETRQKLSEKDVEKGTHEEKKSAHEQRIKQRNLDVKNSAQAHGIRGYEAELDDSQIDQFVEKITRLSKEQNAKVERLRAETHSELMKIQGLLDNLREQRSAASEGKKIAKAQIAENEQRITHHQTELKKIKMDEGQKATLDATITDLQSSFTKLKEEHPKGVWDSKIKESNRELLLLEDESTSLNRELIHSTKEAGNLARLDHLQKEFKNRDRSLEIMKGAHGDRIRSLIGPGWEDSRLEADYRRVLETKKREVLEAEKKRDLKVKELEHLDFKLKAKRNEVKEKKRTSDQAAKHMQESIHGEGVEQYLDILEQLRSDKYVKKNDVDGFLFLKDFYDSCIKFANRPENPHCKICKRPFNEEKMRKDFVRDMQRKASQTALEESRRELDLIETELKEAESARTSYDTWKRLLDTELPSLKAEISGLETDRESLLREVEEHDRKVNMHTNSQRDIETSSTPIMTIVNLANERTNLKGQIDELLAQQKEGDISRTLEEIQEHIKSVAGKSQNLKNVLAKLQADEKRTREQMNALELDLGKAKSRVATAEHELEKKNSISKQITDLKQSNQTQRETISALDVTLQDLEPKFSEAETKRDDVKRRGEEKAKELQEEASRLLDDIRGLQRADQDIKTYAEEGSPAKLAKCKREIKNYGQEIVQLEAELRQITVEINKITEEITNHDRIKAIINDNLKYRKAHRELDTVKQRITELKAQNSEIDQDAYRKEADRLKRQHNLLSTEETSKMGAMKAKDDQLLQLLEDWNRDYKDAGLKYKESHIRVETTKAAVEDLGRYGSALDKAIMKYHSLKMEEINRIVEELWKKTYQGTDVDTILIRSDSESGKLNRSYNYRVCMMKQDAEMDMRGRCSAGQRVLACIIIRLALAECFGTNCGLIALDEPTTNLDRDNIHALATSLHNIINDRRKQSNFQLIVITHDEDFLRAMNCADFSDNYYRVSRNERQKSTIERQSIAAVM
ncbi:MAG: DNA repair protein rad50 [Icmadophila ericetorum]|nr:DNA repair protein rad50 [Icmadophila ericetorum]